MTIETLDLFELSKEQEEQESNLTTRQHRLIDFLKDNFVSGKYFSIEEIVEYFKDKNGEPYYKLNTNPYNHDKCVALSNDIRKINWNITDRHHTIIVKDKKGGCKLCESETEFDNWRKRELEPIETKCKYLNNLVWKSNQEGVVPLVNQKGRALTPEEMKPIEIYAKEMGKGSLVELPKSMYDKEHLIKELKELNESEVKEND